jgi:DUF971 family protein
LKADARSTPVEIGPTEDGDRLRIVWQDGAESLYAPRDLRLACPCAGCVDEMTGQPRLVPNAVPADVMPISIHYVGRYALQFVWSDGHQTGIYPYEYLRRLGE